MTEASQVEIILGIPGIWPTRNEIITSIAKQTDGLMFVGNILLDTKTKKGYSIDVSEYDPALQRSFIIAGGELIAEQDLKAIAKHTYTLYVIGPGGTLNTAQEMIQVAVQLLKAGGIAVKVETAGVAHARENWQKFASDTLRFLSDAYTAFVRGQDFYYSCGMHNLGLRDVMISDDIDLQVAYRLIKIFLKYTVLENPALKDGHTFSLDEQSPSYRLTHQEDTFHPSGDPFHNPFGLWDLSRIV